MKTVFMSMPPLWRITNSERRRWTASFCSDMRTVIQNTTKMQCVMSTEFEDTTRGRQNRRTAVGNAELVVFLPFTGSWIGGVDYQIAQQNNIPTMVICSTRALHEGHVPRILLDDRNSRGVVTYSNRRNAVSRLREQLPTLRRRREPKRDTKATTAKRVKSTLRLLSRGA